MIVVVAVALGLAIRSSVHHWNDQSRKSSLTLADLDFRWLLLSAVLYGIGLLPASFVLSRALSALGFEVPISRVAAAQLIGHLGKYVPGKAMVVVLRASVLNRQRPSGNHPSVSLRAATIAITVETLTVIATGAMWALCVLVFLDTPIWMKQTSLFMAVAAAVGTWPPIIKRVLSRRIVGGTLSFQWKTSDMLAAWFWNTIAWLLIGGAMMATVLALPESMRTANDLSLGRIYAVSFASISLAFVAGFLSFLPGGAGVREVVLTTMLASIVGPSGSLIAAIIMRVVHLAVEAILAAAAWKCLPQTGTGATDMDDTPPVD